MARRGCEAQMDASSPIAGWAARPLEPAPALHLAFRTLHEPSDATPTRHTGLRNPRWSNGEIRNDGHPRNFMDPVQIVSVRKRALGPLRELLKHPSAIGGIVCETSACFPFSNRLDDTRDQGNHGKPPRWNTKRCGCGSAPGQSVGIRGGSGSVGTAVMAAVLGSIDSVCTRCWISRAPMSCLIQRGSPLAGSFPNCHPQRHVQRPRAAADSPALARPPDVQRPGRALLARVCPDAEPPAAGLENDSRYTWQRCAASKSPDQVAG